MVLVQLPWNVAFGVFCSIDKGDGLIDQKKWIDWKTVHMNINVLVQETGHRKGSETIYIPVKSQLKV